MDSNSLKKIQNHKILGYFNSKTLNNSKRLWKKKTSKQYSFFPPKTLELWLYIEIEFFIILKKCDYEY
jgi:hypothetical protein